MKTKHTSTRSTVEAEGSDRTRSTASRRKRFALALGGFLFASLFALPAPRAEAECQQWNVGHGWRFTQGSGKGAIIVEMNLQQNGRVITGTAKHILSVVATGGPLAPTAHYAIPVGGTVDGTVEGDSFAVKIYWDNNTIGVYDGTIRPSGRIEGKGYEQRSSRKKVSWHSETTMKCADADVVQPTNPTPKPISRPKALATPTPKPISRPKTQPAAGTPTISVHPTVISIPDGQTEGTVTLTWDGGPDHPDARPWLKATNNAEEVMVADQAEGTRRLPVERGTNYLFILKDSDQQLAKAAVISKR